MIDAALDPRPERRPQPEQLAVVFRKVAPELSDDGALEASELEEPGRARVRVDARGRVLAAAASAALTYAVLHLLAPPTTFASAEMAALTGLLVALLPRLGWIA